MITDWGRKGESQGQFGRRHGVRMMHYHTDNYILTKRLFQEDEQAQKQSISYCGVGAHLQKGWVEKLIRDIQDQGTRVLLYIKQRLPDAITKHLWLYAYNICTKF